jgi:hypothetical protein
MGIANLQTSTQIFAHGDPVNDGLSGPDPFTRPRSSVLF